MGLPTGPHGVKELVKTRCLNCWNEFGSLKAARVAYGREAHETVVILDGNVLVRQVPVAAATFDEYTTIFHRFLTQALDTADVVVVVFDEPLKMTKAKAEEQARRDLQSKKSAPIMSTDLEDALSPQTDDYDFEVAMRANPHDILRSRKARPRMFDCICKHSMKQLIDSEKYNNKILVFDGIDPRGASRPHGDAREATMYSNSELAETLLSRPDDAPVVAEGDLKMTDIESEIQYLRDNGTFFVSVNLVLVCTIDTDSIAIELMHQSSKNEQLASRGELEESVKTVLCFREVTRKRKDDDENSKHAPASFACFDMDLLHKSIVSMLGAPPGYHRHASALLASAWALCGSDFVHLKGMRSDMAFEAVAELCKSEEAIQLLSYMEASWQLKRDTPPLTVKKVRLEMLHPISHVVEKTALRLSKTPRMGRSVKSIKEVTDCEETTKNILLRAAWIAVYWSGLQCPNAELCEWGFINGGPVHYAN